MRRVYFLLFALLFVGTAVHAEGMSGTQKYAWSENGGWINFNPTSGNVEVTDGAMTGYAWSETFGWINLDPANGGVLNDGGGNLSGSAWGEQTGWIDFDGVTIGNDGVFSGYASGSVIGRINFNCATNDSCAGNGDFGVQTDWRRASASSSSTTVTHGNGGGRGAGTALRLATDAWMARNGEEARTDSASDPFTDVPSTHRYRDAILWLASHGIAEGYDDRTYRPEDTINRAEFTKIMIASGGDESGLAECTDGWFPDVPAAQWFTTYVCLARQRGVVDGYPDGWFRPEATINVAEAAKIIVRSSGIGHETVDGDEWYSPYVRALRTRDAYPTEAREADAMTRGQMAFVIWMLNK